MTQTNGARPQTAARIAVVITDGYSSRPDLTQQEIELIHKSGIYVFSIGMEVIIIAYRRSFIFKQHTLHITHLLPRTIHTSIKPSIELKHESFFIISASFRPHVSCCISYTCAWYPTKYTNSCNTWITPQVWVTRLTRWSCRP